MPYPRRRSWQKESLCEYVRRIFASQVSTACAFGVQDGIAVAQLAVWSRSLTVWASIWDGTWKRSNSWFQQDSLSTETIIAATGAPHHPRKIWETLAKAALTCSSKTLLG